MKLDPEEKAKQMSWFDTEARVVFKGEKYGLSYDEIAEIHGPAYYWHYEGDPSSWLVARMVTCLRRKYKGVLPRAKVIELAGGILKRTVEQVESTLNWNANYMAFHDGGIPEEEHAYPPDSE